MAYDLGKKGYKNLVVLNEFARYPLRQRNMLIGCNQNTLNKSMCPPTWKLEFEGQPRTVEQKDTLNWATDTLKEKLSSQVTMAERRVQAHL